jgi:hypothetical protein
LHMNANIDVDDVKGVGRVHDFGWTRKVGYRLIGGTLLVWILNSCCFDHGDVTWDCSRGKNSEKHKSFLDKKFWERLGGAIGTYW